MANFITLLIFSSTCLLLLVSAERPIGLGKFRTFDHGVRSGRVQILDEKTIKIHDFHYDGDAPDAWFVVGDDNKYTQEKPRGGLPFKHIVPDENGSCQKPGKYSGKTIELTLPGDVTTADISYLAVYCISFNHNFGYIKIPRGLRAPKSTINGPTKRCPRSERGKSKKSQPSGYPASSADGEGSSNRKTVREIIRLLKMLQN